MKGFAVRSKKKPGKWRAVITHNEGAELREWRERVRRMARQCGAEPDGIDCPIGMDLMFSLPRPASHLRKDGTAKPNAPFRPTTKPDFDKLTRAIADALTGVCYDDDSRIVSSRIDKVWASRDGVGGQVVGVVVRVWNLDQQHDERTATSHGELESLSLR